MKLLVHNILTSKCLKGVKVGYPLAIKAEEVTTSVVDFNTEFIQRIIPKLEWNVLKEACDNVMENGYLPNELTENYSNDEELLKKIHHVLMEIEIIKGNLVCPETGRSFPITNGIPNMLLNEDEV
ncbi:multifunctional methyltransferase subunit TRM112-like protein [Harmonia axyridis]|uniref:multifunctional methyltransferase subunit TRM112-like protein n=1 Tax=Harmonia axyridis TaxID=115357 RepID=UPI001E2774BE|nr:multifunctional methyltransferase subunit TRM112-like protein [Harmonia axyridis]